MTKNENTERERKHSDKNRKFVPKVDTVLRNHIIQVPKVIYDCSGIQIMRRRIKSIIFTTDVAIMRNHNADALMAVYPFTPELVITQAAINCSPVPVFAGVGGGQTTGKRSVGIAFQAELIGAAAVVVNSPTKPEVIRDMFRETDIPIIATVGSIHDEVRPKIEAGARILNVSGGAKTAELVRQVREIVGPDFPIIATGGPTDETILDTIAAGANAITYTPPSCADIFSEKMAKYREQAHKTYNLAQEEGRKINDSERK